MFLVIVLQGATQPQRCSGAVAGLGCTEGSFCSALGISQGLQTEFDPLNFRISCPVLLKFRCCWKGAPLGKLSRVCNSGVSIIVM